MTMTARSSRSKIELTRIPSRDANIELHGHENQLHCPRTHSVGARLRVIERRSRKETDGGRDPVLRIQGPTPARRELLRVPQRQKAPWRAQSRIARRYARRRRSGTGARAGATGEELADQGDQSRVATAQDAQEQE